MPLTSALSEAAQKRELKTAAKSRSSGVRSGATSPSKPETETEPSSLANHTSGSHSAERSTGRELARLFDLVAEDFAAVNELIPRQLTSDVDLVESIGRYIVESGGKRLRPLIVLLGARACGIQSRDHIRLAAIIEFLHTATLLHDDVVDRSGLRRGRATANALWGNAPSVLVGDFLYSRAFQLMVELENLDVMAILADATNVIAEGEVLQLANIGNPDLTEDSYREVIRCKTAMLFQAAAHSSAVLGHSESTEAVTEAADEQTQKLNQEQEHIERLRDYGLHFGTAYQLVDDWLDYAGDTEVMGKNVGDDLAEGKATLPLIYTMANGASEDSALIREALESKCSDQLELVCAAVKRSGALDYTREAAHASSALAIEALLELPANPYRDALEDLVRAAVGRLS